MPVKLAVGPCFWTTHLDMWGIILIKKLLGNLHVKNFEYFCMLTEYICHVYVRSDSLTGLVIGDYEYPQRVAHTLINKVGDCRLLNKWDGYPCS